jgi:hypothetical protein
LDSQCSKGDLSRLDQALNFGQDLGRLLPGQSGRAEKRIYALSVSIVSASAMLRLIATSTATLIRPPLAASAVPLMEGPHPERRADAI